MKNIRKKVNRRNFFHHTAKVFSGSAAALWLPPHLAMAQESQKKVPLVRPLWFMGRLLCRAIAA